jgi:L-ascorbate metabolism protein UlaG (beta-lactamase superfamily)
MKKAFCTGTEFKETFNQACSDNSGDDFRLWWLGQSGFLILWRDKKLLIDPYLSDSLTNKYAGTDKPHVRMTERVIDPELLPVIDIVTSSHNHTDHLDAETLIPVFKTSPNASFVIPEANRQFVCERIGCKPEFPIGLNDGQSVRIHDFVINAVPSAHNSIERDHLGRSIYLGYVISFGPWTIYHSGDTMLFDGMEELLRSFKIDIALLPINGYDPARRVAGNLDGKQAADLARGIGARIVIPHHFDMFEFNTASPELFESSCKEISQEFYIMQQGASLNFQV